MPQAALVSSGLGAQGPEEPAPTSPDAAYATRPPGNRGPKRARSIGAPRDAINPRQDSAGERRAGCRRSSATASAREDTPSFARIAET